MSLSRTLDEWKQGGNKKEVEFLITGCARSGTHYIAKVLRLHGLDVVHEGNARCGIVSWPMAVNSDNSPWGPGSNNYYFKHIFHQVRHPLKTIASVMLTEPGRTWHYVCKAVPEIKLKDPRIIRAAKYWYYWNLIAESKAELTYRVEDVAETFPELSRILGYTLDTAFLNNVSTDAGTRKRKPRNLTWLDLRKALNDNLYDKIVCLAERYGYDVREAKRYNFKRKGK
ncbi:MAG: hypothetical protein LLG04_00820 [Parachlamydia sp.]|nr:hypothetical protein [Parachlamydia sp.]